MCLQLNPDWRPELTDNEEVVPSTDEIIRDYRAELHKKVKAGNIGLAKELAELQVLEEESARPKAALIERLRPKRRYSLTPEAVAARQKNSLCSTGPRTPGGKHRSSRNSWKHGQAAAGLVARIVKPCTSTCEIYDTCEFIFDEKTEPGGDCLDREHFIQILGAIQEALAGNRKDFDGLAAVMLANVMDMVNGMLEKLHDDQYMVIEQKVDERGRVLSESYKPHPLLFSLPKLLSDLGLTLIDWNATPGQISKNKIGEDGVKTLGEMMSAAMGKAGKARE